MAERTAQPTTLHPLFVGLIDDAALFPPGNAPMDVAVPEHRRHRTAWYAELVGPFLCTDTRLPELRRRLDAEPEPSGDPDAPAEREPLDLALIVTGGAGALGPAVTWVRRDRRLRLTGIEIALRDEPDPGRNARRVAYACDDIALEPGITVSMEIPRVAGPTGLDAALDVLAETGHRAKLRTGGATPDLVPSESEVAGFLTACLDREVPFKCTAGLHHALRHTSPEGLQEQGFLNILLATRAALDGADHDDLVRLLADRDPASVVARTRALDDRQAASARRWFTSYGSCSIAEPLADLADLGLLEVPT